MASDALLKRFVVTSQKDDQSETADVPEEDVDDEEEEEDFGNEE